MEEVRDLFLERVRTSISYWASLGGDMSTTNRLAGLAHSILVALDGEANDLPAFAVIPIPCDGDMEHCKSLGEDWFPEHQLSGSECNIAGSLHEMLFKAEQGGDDARL